MIRQKVGHCDLPFDLAQGGGESFDSTQDRGPVERLVEPFGICILLYEISEIVISLAILLKFADSTKIAGK